MVIFAGRLLLRLGTISFGNFAYDRGLSLSTTNEYIHMGSTGGVTHEGIRISGISSDLYPYTDGGANIGMSNRRWWTGYIRYMVTEIGRASCRERV